MVDGFGTREDLCCCVCLPTRPFGALCCFGNTMATAHAETTVSVPVVVVGGGNGDQGMLPACHDCSEAAPLDLDLRNELPAHR